MVVVGGGVVGVVRSGGGGAGGGGGGGVVRVIDIFTAATLNHSLYCVTQLKDRDSCHAVGM